MVAKKVLGLADEEVDAEGRRHIKQDVIDHTNSQIQMVIDSIIPKTQKLKEQQEKDIIRKFNTEMKKMRDAIEEQKSFKGDQEGDLKERENEMQHNLELITSIAQRIDNENRLLIKRNAELKADFKAQENDRELLVRQLVMQKKENAKLKDEMAEFKKIIKDKQQDEEQIDIQTFVQDVDQNANAADPARQTKNTFPKMGSQVKLGAGA